MSATLGKDKADFEMTEGPQTRRLPVANETLEKLFSHANIAALRPVESLPVITETVIETVPLTKLHVQTSEVETSGAEALLANVPSPRIDKAGPSGT